MVKLKKMFFAFATFFKPAGGKCPGCGSTSSSWNLDRTGPNGEKYYSCSSCGYKVKD